MKHRFVALTLWSFIGLSSAMNTASAQDYPTRPIRMVTAYTGGGEAVIRMIAEKLSAILKQPVVVEPIPAAAGVQAAAVVARAAPDGYTLLAANSTTHIIKPLTLKSISYDPIKDFTPISTLNEPTLALAVRADLGITDVSGLIERSKKTRTILGASGFGGTSHVSMLALNKATGGKLEFVPFKDDGSMSLGLLSGDIDAAIGIGTTLSQLLQREDNAKKIRIIGVFNRTERPGFDNVKTVAEQVPGFKELVVFSAFWGPAGLPRDIVERLNAAIGEAARDQIVSDRMRAMGSIANPGTPDQLNSTISAELVKVGGLLKEAGIEPE